MPGANLSPAQKPPKEAVSLHIVGGTDAGEIDLAEAWDSMLQGRFMSEQAFGQYLVQKKMLEDALANKNILSEFTPVAQQEPRSFYQGQPMGQQQQTGRQFNKPNAP